jgi:hypothetical protein
MRKRLCQKAKGEQLDFLAQQVMQRPMNVSHGETRVNANLVMHVIIDMEKEIPEQQLSQLLHINKASWVKNNLARHAYNM